MANSSESYTGDGATNTFTIPFDYFSKAELTVTVDAVEVAFTLNTSTQFSIDSGAPANGTTIKVQRSTIVSPARHIFARGSTPSSSDFNEAIQQLLRAIQEIAEGVLPAVNSIRTGDLLDGVLSADATGRAKMADSYVTLAKLLDGILTADATGRLKMADGFVNTAKLLDGVLTANAAGRAKMADGYINTAKLLDSLLSADAAGRAKVADGFMTFAKLASAAYSVSTDVRGNSNSKLLTEGAASAHYGAFQYSFLHIEDRKASGTDGGTFTSGAWRTRDLTTVLTNEISGASLSSNQITLPAGTYYWEAIAPGHRVARHILRVRDITAGATLLNGPSRFSDSSDNSTTEAFVRGRFTLGASSVVELQHRCSITVANVGFGVSTGAGFAVDTEVFSSVLIWKVA